MTREAALLILNALGAGTLSTLEVQEARREAFRYLDSLDEVARAQSATVVAELDEVLADRKVIAEMNERSAHSVFVQQLDHRELTGRWI